MDHEVTPTPEEVQETKGPEPPPKCECLHCGYSWKPRHADKRPSSCPQCGTAYWDRKPLRRNARRPTDAPNPNWRYRFKPIKRRCPTCGRTMTRLTVKERKRLEEKERERLAAEAEAAAQERPSRSTTVTVTPEYARSLERQFPKVMVDAVRRRGMTPPPTVRDPAPPPPSRPRAADNPETVGSRSLAEELEEKTK